HVTATGTDLSGQPVTATASATVTVITPALTLTKDATPGVVRVGDPITFTITVANAGDAPLTEVAVTDDRTPACAKAIGALPPQGTSTYTCTTVAGATGLANKPAATGVDPTARPVTAVAEAAFVVQHPGVAITAEVTGGPFRAGDRVPLRITVRNTGDVP